MNSSHRLRCRLELATNVVDQRPEDYFDRTTGFDHDGAHETIHEFGDASEAEVYLTQCRDTAVRSIVKYTYSLRVKNYRDLKSSDSITWHYPNEARALLQHIKPHPGITQVLEVHEGVDPGRFFMRFAYCNAGDLVGQIDYTRNKRRQYVQEPFLLHILIELMDLLAYTHNGLLHVGDGKYEKMEDQKPMIHGDVKEDNTFLRWDTPEAIKTGLPTIVLGDWGTAVLVGSSNNKIGVGTWDFHAPEEIHHYTGLDYDDPRNFRAYRAFLDGRTQAVDMYALGQIMYKLSANEKLNRAIGKDPDDIKVSRNYDTPGLMEVVKSLLAVDPALRGEASFKEGLGLLPQIQKFRLARDEMLVRRGRPDIMDWLCKPPRIART